MAKYWQRVNASLDQVANIFKTASGTYCARIRHRGMPAKTKTFPSHALAVAWARAEESEHASIRAGVLPRSMTVADLIDRYEREFSTVKPFGRNKAWVLKTLRGHLGEERLSALSSERIVRYIKDDRRISGVTASIDLSYLGVIIRVARQLWKMPLSDELVADARAVLNHAGLVHRSNERDRRPTSEEIDKIRGWLHIHSRSLRPEILDFILDSGFRPPSEIVNLRWSDLNEADRTIVIRDRKHPRKKIGNHQTVPLLGRCFEIVKRQPQTSEFIFPVNGKSWSSIFPRACRELGIEDLQLYDFRHEAISRLVESSQYSIPEIMLISGHSDPKMMMRYTQLRAKNLHR